MVCSDIYVRMKSSNEFISKKSIPYAARPPEPPGTRLSTGCTA